MGKHLQTAKPRTRQRTLPSIVGQQFKFLTVLDERRTKNGLGKSRFDVLVRCVCGVDKWVEERGVRRGLVTSCGSCANKTHGASNTPEYAIWRSMLARCNRKSHQAYKNYGGRGVVVCAEWGTFEQFFADMGKQPFKGASIERKDNNRGYEKDNCVWANATEQNRNRRTNHVLTVNGVSKTVAEWAQLSGIRHNTISYRIAHGWTPEAAVSIKPNFTNKGAVYGDC